MLVKDGNRLAYTTNDGEIIKCYRKEWERNENGCLDTLMAEFSKQAEKSVSEITTTVVPETEAAE
jgi:hypothetical protein